MPEQHPIAELDRTFSSDQARTSGWSEVRSTFRDAQVYWVSTVRPEGRPHVTPLIGVWHDGAAYFCTGPEERKARNLLRNRHCSLTTGRNGLDDGIDVVVEGEAVVVDAGEERDAVAEAYELKYGKRFTEAGGTWFGLGEQIRVGDVLLFRVAPTTVFGFGKGAQFSQTRWTFGQERTDA